VRVPIDLPAAFAEVVERRRSTRTFDPHRDVGDAIVHELLELARWAPSGGNAQPWEFIVIRDAACRRRIVELYREQVRAKEEMESTYWGTRLTTGNVGFRHAPVLILILCDPRTARAFPIRTIREKSRDHLMSSMANATLIVHLAAAARGMATQWLSDVSSPYMSVMLAEMLGIPDHLDVYDMIALGWPRSIPDPTPRRPLTEIVHWERFDQRLERDTDALDEFLWTQTRLAAFGARPGARGRRGGGASHG
jgi:5,6-dimethylbenzimidazole synthase